jgi:hypothetical protein
MRVLLYFLAAFLVIPAVGMEVLFYLADGTVIQGELEAGIPTNLSMNLATGGTVVLKLSDLKTIRLYRGTASCEVEDWSGQIYKGEILNLGSAFTVREPGGASRSIPIGQVVSITFSRPSGSPVLPVTPSKPGPSVQVSEDLAKAFSLSQWSFFLGLGYSVAGLIERNGFGFPRNEVGLNVSLGLHWRHFFLPSWFEVQNILSECGAMNVAAAKDCLDITRFFYIQLATDLLISPSVGMGVLISFAPNAFFDLGILLNLGLLVGWGWPYPFPYLGVLIVF